VRPLARHRGGGSLRDFTPFLWLLKLGALLNLYFFSNTLVAPASHVDPSLLVPAQILFAVSAFRCLLPNQYKHNVVFHDTPLSSIFLTRVLATLAEVAFVYQLSRVLRLLNVERLGWVDVLSWWMVAQVVISQLFVWGAILTGRLALYFWEELGWLILVAANAIASAALYANRDVLGSATLLLQINLVFGVVYLAWQLANLRLQIADARRAGETLQPFASVSWERVREGLRRSLHERSRKTDSDSWGGPVVLLWMIGYFATLLPMWANQIVTVFSR